MKVSASITLVMQLAGREAAAADFKEIEPAHFLAGVLKLADVWVEEISKITAGEAAIEALATELGGLRDELRKRSIESTRVRRELRAKLGKGTGAPDNGEMHRSEASRTVFDFASRLADSAGSETLTVTHLLEALLDSPSPVMAQVLGKVQQAGAGHRKETPLLERYGRDLRGLVAEGKQRPVSGREAECKALVHALGHRRSVVLIGDSNEAALEIVTAAAQSIPGGPAPSKLNSKRIVDVTAKKLSDSDAIEQFQKLFAEARGDESLILFVPAITSGHVGKGDSESAWRALLKETLARQSVQFICRTDAETFRQQMGNDAVWKRFCSTMWIRDRSYSDIPTEI